MDGEIEQLVVSVRADTAGFARDVAAMRGELEGPLAAGVGRAGRLIETSLSRALVSGKLGFEDLKKIALSAMAQIAQASLRALFSPGSGAGGGGVGSALTTALSSLLGAPGRSHGGPVSAGRTYVVGERGPELFVPSGSGRIEAARGGGRDVRVAISISTPQPGDPGVLRQSSRQLARAVRSAIREDRR
ncbi:MAG: tail tape measure protein [Sphingomonas sp.]|uniref:tail tape measure protein n=1 Tax=Sphingomonas sp. TaxID=28214 RepID=UPI0017CD3B36|nr:tail tape measure protein [Sphingomonas sp.]MBA3667755.1 tail tape measure protein [Sphingomonas sp.]